MNCIFILNTYIKSGLIFAFFALLVSCKKLVEVQPPTTNLTGANIYSNDGTAIAAITSNYDNMSSGGIFTGYTGISLLCGLSADEFTLSNSVANSDAKYYYYLNALYANTGTTTTPGTEFWSPLYNFIFICNSAISGISNNISLTPTVKQQLLGEAKFLRAFYYFYLTNLYGEVPLALNTDFKINNLLGRISSNAVYQQIISDLKDAVALLSNNYLDGSLLKVTEERIRPTKWAAFSLLSKVYLFTGDWSNSESLADSVISNSALYSLETLNNVFLKNSMEAIWQLQPVNLGWNTEDARIFIIPSTGPNGNFNGNPVYLSKNLLDSFELNDQRRFDWVDSVIVNTDTFYFPYKYKNATLDADVTEYLMVMRLGEQYLIRAEARAEQGNFDGAVSDLNIIRNRANLPNTNAVSKDELLSAIHHERQIELFSEWGSRWLDLKRLENISSVMDTACAQKGGVWQNYQQMYPVPLSDIELDKNLIQTPGY